MRTQMLVTDLDGTLLRGDKTVSARTWEALEACRARGIKIVYATARPLRTVRVYTQDFAPDATIVHNGAGVYLGETALSAAEIPRPDAARILLALSRAAPRGRLSAEIGAELYANFDAAALWPQTTFHDTDFAALPEGPVYKIIAELTERLSIAAVRALLPESVYAETADGRLALIMEKSAAKLSAIDRLCARWNIPREAVAAFGDDHNDVAMLRACGIGVAMENAIPEARAAADQICPNNEADGVARWIEEHLLA